MADDNTGYFTCISERYASTFSYILLERSFTNYTLYFQVEDRYLLSIEK